MKGKPWTVEEENLLRQMVAEGKSARSIARTLGKSRESVKMKISRLELDVVVEPTAGDGATTTSLELPKKLANKEATLRMENAALNRLCQDNLTKTEITRLVAIGTMAKNYREGLADYLNSRKLEVKLDAMAKKYEDICEKYDELSREYEEICKKYEEVSRENEALRKKMESAATRENGKVDASGEVSSSDSSSKPA